MFKFRLINVNKILNFIYFLNFYQGFQSKK